jgi:16S rRNA (uracil1498-N3)-methyltransferase
MIPRFFCPFPLHPGATVELAAEAAHHALKVLRVGAGDTAILFDGRGGQWHATLHPAGKSLRATWTRVRRCRREPPLMLTLVQALPAGDKMDLVVQKAVELGVMRIQPVAAKRSVIRLSGERAERRVEHWRNIAIAACEQSGRNRIPAVAPILDLPQYLGIAAQENALRFVCAPGVAGPARARGAEAPVSLLVGPEGGFEDGELLAAHAAGFHADWVGAAGVAHRNRRAGRRGGNDGTLGRLVMFESAEIGHKIDKQTYKKEVPALRAALQDAQYDLKENGKIPVVVLVSGQDGAGKGETINILYEWMDPRFISTLAFSRRATKSVRAPSCGATGAPCRPRAASASSPDRGIRARSTTASTAA